MTDPPTPSSSTIRPPKLVAQKGKTDGDASLECSVHTLPKPLLREFRHVFGESYLEGNNNAMDDDTTTTLELLALPTNQRARQDLVAVGDHIEQEKDRLLNVVRGGCLLYTSPSPRD